jgi:glycosyltransferase involved in cell wall biosynthesis
MLDGALAGLSLLHDEPNFRHSLPTKVVEYMARGVPVVTTPLPAAAELARGYECGFVVPFGDPKATPRRPRTRCSDCPGISRGGRKWAGAVMRPPIGR